MAKLIVLNGAPGVGKSTIARRYVDEHPMALALDVDTVRSLIGSWQDTPTEAGEAARAMAVEMAGVHLAEGHDVIVPQLLAKAPFLDALVALSRKVGSSFVEIVLSTDRDSLATRLARRADSTIGAFNPLGLAPSAEKVVGLLDEWVDRVGAFVADRPAARIIDASGDPDETYRLVIKAIER